MHGGTRMLQAAANDGPSPLRWAIEYLSSANAGPAEAWHGNLLHDIRTPATHPGLLPERRPAVRHEGFLGKIRVCRQGFGHWWRLPGEELALMLCQGRLWVATSCSGGNATGAAQLDHRMPASPHWPCDPGRPVCSQVQPRPSAPHHCPSGCHIWVWYDDGVRARNTAHGERER